MPSQPGRDVVHLSEKALDAAQKFERGLDHGLEKTLARFGERIERLAGKNEDHASEKALESWERLGRIIDHKTEKTLDLIGDLISRQTGREVEQLLAAPERPRQDAAPSPQGVTDTRQASLSAESLSLSVSGSIETRDGAKLSFSLALQYDHVLLQGESAQLQSDGNGATLNYAGSAAELTSTSFSFSLNAEGSFKTARGIGNFMLDRDDRDSQHHRYSEGGTNAVTG